MPFIRCAYGARWNGIATNVDGLNLKMQFSSLVRFFPTAEASAAAGGGGAVLLFSVCGLERGIHLVLHENRIFSSTLEHQNILQLAEQRDEIENHHVHAFA